MIEKNLMLRRFEPNLGDAIMNIASGLSFNCTLDITSPDSDPTYDDFEFLQGVAPTQDEAEQELQRLRDKWNYCEYMRKRVFEYPPMEDLADAIYWNEAGDSSKLDAYVEACAEVKTKYPKPDES